MATVITSRRAKKELEKIKAHHAEILKGLQAHQENMKQVKMQKDQENKERATQDREYAHRGAELEIERANIGSKMS